MGYSTPEKARAGWLKYRQSALPYVIKTCGCGVKFKPISGPQKRCDQCRQSTCAVCQVCFIPPDGKRAAVYCSRACKDQSQRGFEPEHLKANRGIKPRTYHLRVRDKHGSALDRDWRKAVFERDDYTCQACFVKGGRLQAHHIKPYKAFPELRHELSNGQTLCVECHKKTDTYGWTNYWKANRLRQGVLWGAQ